jgi:hypothetical protein
MNQQKWSKVLISRHIQDVGRCATIAIYERARLFNIAALQPLTVRRLGAHIVGLPRWLRSGSAEGDSKLKGVWHRVGPLGDGESAVEVHFCDGGQLRYCVLEKGKWQIMRLTYRVEGHNLVTDQPSAPHEEKTRFEFDGDDGLVLEFAGEESIYRRGERRAPVV